MRVVDDGQLGVAAAGQERHHPSAVLGLTGAFEARDVGRGARRRRIAAGALGEIGAVDAGGADADQHLSLVRDGIGALLELETPCNDDGGTHSGMLRP
jgi:hypothetical protein